MVAGPGFSYSVIAEPVLREFFNTPLLFSVFGLRLSWGTASRPNQRMGKTTSSMGLAVENLRSYCLLSCLAKGKGRPLFAVSAFSRL